MAVESKSVLQKVHFTTLGCPKNQVDTEVMASLVRKAGLEITANPAEADCIVVNTCAFLKASQEESIDSILDLSRFRKDGSCKKLVVTGCLASRFPTEIEGSLPEVDHFLGTADLHKIQDLVKPSQKTLPINLISNQQEFAPPEDYLKDRFHDGSLYSRYLKIAEGCDRACSFCIIPTLRGPQRSRTIENLVAEAQTLVAQGAKEINLIAQDLTAYGHDLPKTMRLEDLVAALLEKVLGLNWLRLHYVYPQRISDRLIDLFSQSKTLLPYLDMPLQHISDKMLKSMNRGTTGNVQRKLLAKLRERIPDLVLRTTFIVGFPGETDEDFEELLDFMRESRFDHVGAFRYSREEGTEAAKLDHQVPEKVKSQRWHQLMTLQKEISAEKNEERLGRQTQALVMGPSPESELLIAARSWHQAPEIDGLTYIADLGEASASPKPGDLVNVLITQAHDYDLAASLVSVEK